MKIGILTVLLFTFLIMLADAKGRNGQIVHDTLIDCDISAHPCSKTVAADGLEVVFDTASRPVTSMKELTLIFKLRERGQAVTDAVLGLDLTMPGMFMGQNRPVLSHTGNGVYTGTAIFPNCPHGGKVWKADIKITRGSRVYAVSYVFEVQ